MLKSFREFSSENEQKNNFLNKLINLAWSRYEPETKDFLTSLSSKDPDIKSIFDQLSNFENNSEPDVISRNMSDAEFGNEEV